MDLRLGFHRLLTLAGVLVLVLSACGSSSPSSSEFDAGARENGLARYYDQKPTWKSCFNNLECAEVIVPLDWQKPTDRTIELEVARQSSKGKSLGYLFYNPGGPGVSPVDYLSTSGNFLVSPSVAEHYALVAVDPRGVGRSTPVSCKDPRGKDRLLFGPDSPEQAKLNKEAFYKACQEHSGDLLDYVDTASSARDMDVVRAVLQAPKLNYLGYSYGTYLGSLYATLFPREVGRMVLDAPFDQSQGSQKIILGQIAGFENSLKAYLDQCQTEINCPYYGTPTAKALEDLSKRLHRLEDHPVRLSNGLDVDGQTAALGLIFQLYSPRTWPRLSEILKALKEGNPAPLFESAAAYYGRRADGSYATNSFEAQLAISCLDDASAAPSEAEQKKLAQRAKELAPVLGFDMSEGFSVCAGWPGRRAESPVRVGVKDAPEILVVASTGDNATPYADVREFLGGLGQARLLTRQGQGHGSYNMGHTCVNQTVNSFLIHGKLPMVDKVCPS